MRKGDSFPEGGGGGYSTGTNIILRASMIDEKGSLVDVEGEGNLVVIVSDGGRLRRAFRTDVRIDSAIGSSP